MLEGTPAHARRLTLAELEPRCQKPDHRRIGNWLARRVARPLALRVTWVIAPYGISAHTATLAALACGLGGAAALGWGTPMGCLLGVALLHAWYLLDHVDGQLARLQGAASLDGTALDYLMHHLMALAVPLGLGAGLFVARGDAGWLFVGAAWGVGGLACGLLNDVRYKAFFQRLKLLEGRLEVQGGAYRPAPPAPAPRALRPLAGWLWRKTCEPHVVLCVLSVLALFDWLLGDQALSALALYSGLMACCSVGLAATLVVRDLQRGAAEAEFSRWYQLPPGHSLHFTGMRCVVGRDSQEASER